MIISIVAGLILILEITFIVFFIIYAKKNKMIVSKNTIFWFMPVFGFVLALYLLGYFHSSANIDFAGIINSISHTLKLFTFEIKMDYIENILNMNILFSIAFYLAYGLAVFTVIGSALGLIKNYLINLLKIKRIVKQTCNLVIGYNDTSLEYIKNGKDNTILWINNSVDKDKINFLYENKIPFITGNLNYRKIQKYGFKNQVRYNFIAFDSEESEYQNLIDEFISMNQYSKIFFLYLEVKYQEMEIVRREYLKYKNVFNEEQKNKPVELRTNYHLYIRTFSRYELISRKFAEKFTIPLLLPKEFFNENRTIKNDKEINVVFCGFGKVNASLFNIMCQNNQLVKQVEDRLESKLINYYIVDKNSDAINDKRLEYLIDNANKYKNDFLQPEPLCNHYKICKDLNSKEAIEELETIINNKNAYNIIIVSYGSDYQNAETAMWLYNQFNSEKIKVFCRSKRNIIKNDNIVYFGNEQEIISNEYIVEEKLQQLAKDIDYQYSKLSVKDHITNENHWDKLSQVELYSNYYSAMSIRFKLNLLGLDMTRDSNAKSLTKEEFQKIYSLNTVGNNSFEQYYDTKIRNVIAYSEKLRWNAFYLLNGYRPMPKSKIKFNKYEVGGITRYELNRKDHDLKLHACITSYQGLEELHNYIVNHDTNVAGFKLEDIDFYKYDYMLFDNPNNSLIDNLFKLGYKIIYLE